MKKNNCYTADFETTTDDKDCRVWAYALCEIGGEYNTVVGNSIDDMFSLLSERNVTLYFHNLKFDGEFILYWLFRNGYIHVTDKRDLTTKTFTTLISDMGAFYTMKICHKRSGKNRCITTIIDSLKILPFSVEVIAKSFKLPISKLEIDYKAYRAEGHKLTETEIAYIKNDVKIVAMALNTLFEQGMTKMTQGSNALADYKKILGNNLKFRDYFPELDEETDAIIRQAYKGGFTYCNPRFKNKQLGNISVFDVNSLYPSQMYYRPLPYGKPFRFTGKYEPITAYPLYIQRLKCSFKLKKNKLPTIQLKHSLGFMPNEYLTSSKGEYVVLSLTNVDLDLFFDHYNVDVEEWMGGYAFKSKTGLFKDYIDKWMKVKEQSTIEGNSGMRTLAKLMLNALYGKFGLKIQCQSKIPYYTEDGYVKYKLSKPDTREPVYIPMACFITAWARYTTITAAQSVYNRFVYADTDSLHLIGHDIPDGLEVDATKLGAWDYEMQADNAIFIRQKTYMEHPCGKSAEKFKAKEPELYEECNGWKITCSGMPKGCYKYVTPENFKAGSTYRGKLVNTRVKGGVVLVDSEFTIKG